MLYLTEQNKRNAPAMLEASQGVAPERWRFMMHHQSIPNDSRTPIWSEELRCFCVPLSGRHGTDRFALVDADDIEIVAHSTWAARLDGRILYAYRSYDQGPHRFMHRAIMDAADGELVDHINGNGLDNRRQNLRLVTSQQNRMNILAPRGMSGYIGVSWHKRLNKWQVLMKVNGKAIYVGVFCCPIEAAIARDVAAMELHGEFASLNFPELREVLCHA